MLPTHTLGSSGPGAAPRLDFIDASRAFALLLGVVFHASLSFSPTYMAWAVMDVSTHPLIPDFITVSHSFRMELFFLLAGLLSQRAWSKRGTVRFALQRAFRLGIPFLGGWFIIRPLLVSGWVMGAASLRGKVDVPGALAGGFADLKRLPAGIFTGTHLWFLYYLLLVTTALLLANALLSCAPNARRTVGRGADALVKWLGASEWALPILITATAAVLWFMRIWGVDTPDQSLTPQLPVFLLYAGFFSLGWGFARQLDSFAAFCRVTWGRASCLLAAATLTVRLAPIGFDPSHPHHTLVHAVFVVSYATMMWLLVCLVIGVSKLWMRQSLAWVRYLAESAFWIYLVHLPLVVWAQVAVAEWTLPWSLKWFLVTAAALLVALLTYDLLVRNTVLGQLLNGRRRPSALLARIGPRENPTIAASANVTSLP